MVSLQNEMVPIQNVKMPLPRDQLCGTYKLNHKVISHRTQYEIVKSRQQHRMVADYRTVLNEFYKEVCINIKNILTLMPKLGVQTLF